jgi:serine/threonine-protein kinase
VDDASDVPSTDRRPTIDLLAGRYALYALIGAGGAGSVYRARDIELDEIVAVKVLLAMNLDGLAIDMLRREVKLARRVTHKNVARTFDIGEHAGRRFLTMELVEGVSLARIVQGRPLSVARAARIARSIADGLAAAHDAGVIHRDLKPANVLLETTGRVVITDFGIARSSDDGPKSDSFAGTPMYMSPEQLAGASDLDARTDLYALGEILFELLTGRQAWSRTRSALEASERLIASPPDPCALRADVPRELGDLVLRLLARDRADRPASAADVASLLEPFATSADSVAPPPMPRSLTIAVLPFTSDSPGDEHLSDGFTGDLVDTLSTTQTLRVRPRALVRAYRGRSESPVEAGRKLGVDAVVAGAVQRTGDDALQIDVRVLGVGDGLQLWAGSFAATKASFLHACDDAARGIAEALATRLAAPRRRGGGDPVAIDLYLRARQILARRAYGGDVADAVALLEDALARTPDEPNALAAYAIALARITLRADSSRSALQAAERATQLAQHLPDGWLALATVRQMQADYVGMAHALGRALRASPHHAKVHHLVADLLEPIDLVEEGIRRAELALALDPTLRGPAITLAMLHALLRDSEAADAWLMHPSLDAPPISWIASGSRARFAMWERRPAPRVELPDLPEPALQFARFFVDVESAGAVRPETVERLRALRTLESPFIAAFVGQIEAEGWAFAGDTSRALDAIAFADSRSLLDLAWMDRNPLLASVRADPRFHALRASVEARAEAVGAALVEEGLV